MDITTRTASTQASAQAQDMSTRQGLESSRDYLYAMLEELAGLAGNCGDHEVAAVLRTLAALKSE